jgi:glutathione S-transferase
MGLVCCFPSQNQSHVVENKYLASDNKVKLIGFSLNADTYAMLLLLKKARIPFDYQEVNMLAGEHESEEFEQTHPCKYLPILQDGQAFIYGGTFIML